MKRISPSHLDASRTVFKNKGECRWEEKNSELNRTAVEMLAHCLNFDAICVEQSKEIARLCRAAGGSAAVAAAASGAGGRRVLASITALKKLCNHPRLIYDAIRANAAAVQAGNGAAGDAAGLEDCVMHFDPAVS